MSRGGQLSWRTSAVARRHCAGGATCTVVVKGREVAQFPLDVVSVGVVCNGLVPGLRKALSWQAGRGCGLLWRGLRKKSIVQRDAVENVIRAAELGGWSGSDECVCTVGGRVCEACMARSHAHPVGISRLGDQLHVDVFVPDSAERSYNWHTLRRSRTV